MSDPSNVIPQHHLDGQITEARGARYRQVLARRVKHITVVVEELHDPNNIAAVLRTCDAMGIQDVHAIAGRNPFRFNPRVTRGADLHVTVHTHDSVSAAYTALHQQQFQIVASHLAQDAPPPERLVGCHGARLALVFGNEHRGLSPEASDGADGFFKVPMIGLTQSLNLSVAVAISLYTIRREALVDETPGDLSADEQQTLYDKWIRRYWRRRSGRDAPTPETP